ncbi:MAG: restriction endonuclease [Spirochaeta sp.]|jgi:restriction system protein|nr:restriction endonuclease [Spirochaeta sp.]
MAIPKYDKLFNPVLRALHALGGSATNRELEDKVIEILQLPEEEAYERLEGKSQTRLNYRTAWAKSYLKKHGLVDNTERGVWALTAKGQKTSEVDPGDVKATVRIEFANKKRVNPSQDEVPEDEDVAADDLSWQDKLLSVLTEMTPDAFERLSQRLLREAGFNQVEVTGRSGDGGIDGHGVVKLQGLLSFHVYFQCKRYRNTVGSSVVRDFRGAMMGRADKGLIITTGTFTRDAIAEATRDGATPIDLIDGPELMVRLKDLGLGITVSKRIVEDIEIDPEWFQAI